jgi:hypothetical protein
MKRTIKCRVACYNSNGEPELVEVDVKSTYGNVVMDTHRDAAKRMVQDAGYTSAEWVIDQDDPGFDQVFTLPDEDEDAEIPADAHLHDDPRTDSRLADAEGWGLFDVDSLGVGHLQIQRDDEADIFESDDAAIEFVRRVARYSPYHAKAVAIHDSSRPAPFNTGDAIQQGELERWEQIAQVIKKEICYDKHAGTWYWHDRSDGGVPAATGFGTRLQALLDAIEPYLEDPDGE